MTAAADQLLHRYRSVEAKVDDKGRITLTASTDEAVEMWGYREILKHDKKAVDTSTATALLVNHDPNQIAGALRSIAFDGKQSEIVADIDPDARLASGVSVQRAVDSGALKGCSIGYTYGEHDIEYDEKTRTVTVKKWRLLELSLTPMPRDPDAGIREMPALFRSLTTRTAMPAVIPKEPVVTDPANLATPSQAIPVATPAVQAESITRAVVIDNHAIALQAEGLGLRASDFLGKSNAADLMLAEVAKQRQAPVKGGITLVIDEADKIRDQAVDAMAIPYLGRKVDPDSGKVNGADSRGLSWHDIARRFAKRSGVDTNEWTRRDAVDFIFNRGQGLHGRTAEVSANFNQVTALAGAKLIVAGFEGYAPWSDPLVSKLWTNDFKTVRTAGLAMSDFNTPAEGSAFSDLTLDDATANSGVLTMGGGGLELTKQAIYNDELGMFMEKLRRIGWIGARHQDKKFVTALEAASFAAATTTGALAAATLKTAWTAFCAITDPVGEKVGYVPEYLLVPNDTYLTALELTTLAQGATTENGLATNTQVKGNTQKLPLTVIRGRHLTSATAYYLMSNPMEASTVTIVKHNDYPVPQVIEVDAGLVASRKFRIEFPMLALVNFIVATKPVGALKSSGT